MLTFYNEHHAQHGGRTGTQERVRLILAECERRGLGQIVTPHGVPLVSLERVHTPRYLHFLRTAWSERAAQDGATDAVIPSLFVPGGARRDIEPDAFEARLGLYASDAQSPIGAGTWVAAKTGADCAVNAAHALRLGQRGTFALSAPPGHHAGADWYGGGCFLNNAALAAQHLLDDGAQRVAILDLDQRHGNGTQAIFYGRNDVLTISLHADPRGAYPYYAGHADETGQGAGLGYNMNIALPPDAGAADWFLALETACVKLAGFAPEALVVAFGPGAFTLQGGDFLRIGERIGHTGLPAVFVLEGEGLLPVGPEIGINVVNVLEGFETAAL